MFTSNDKRKKKRVKVDRRKKEPRRLSDNPRPRQTKSRLDRVPEDDKQRISTTGLAVLVQFSLERSGLILPIGTVERVLQQYERTILESMVLGKAVRLTGVCNITTVVEPETIAHNVKTGGRVTNARRRVPVFESTLLLSEALKFT